jgi:hypothetical protein
LFNGNERRKRVQFCVEQRNLYDSIRDSIRRKVPSRKVGKQMIMKAERWMDLFFLKRTRTLWVTPSMSAMTSTQFNEVVDEDLIAINKSNFIK